MSNDNTLESNARLHERSFDNSEDDDEEEEDGVSANASATDTAIGRRSGSLESANGKRSSADSPHRQHSQQLLKRPKRLCKFPGCERVVKSQGHCQRHGAKAKRCRIEGCEKQAQGTHDGMCKRHWKEVNYPEKASRSMGESALSKSPGPIFGTIAISVYDSILPQSIAYRPPPIPPVASAPGVDPWANVPGGMPIMPLVVYLRDGYNREPGWHRNAERHARNIPPVQSISMQLEPWERQLALVETLLLSGGTPKANFEHLAYGWGREKGFHTVLANAVCERRGVVERKRRSDAGKPVASLTRKVTANNSSSNSSTTRNQDHDGNSKLKDDREDLDFNAEAKLTDGSSTTGPASRTQLNQSTFIANPNHLRSLSTSTAFSNSIQPLAYMNDSIVSAQNTNMEAVNAALANILTSNNAIGNVLQQNASNTQDAQAAVNAAAFNAIAQTIQATAASAPLINNMLAASAVAASMQQQSVTQSMNGMFDSALAAVLRGNGQQFSVTAPMAGSDAAYKDALTNMSGANDDSDRNRSSVQKESVGRLSDTQDNDGSMEYKVAHTAGTVSAAPHDEHQQRKDDPHMSANDELRNEKQSDIAMESTTAVV